MSIAISPAKFNTRRFLFIENEGGTLRVIVLYACRLLNVRFEEDKVTFIYNLIVSLFSPPRFPKQLFCFLFC